MCPSDPDQPTGRLTHLNEAGDARMVDISGKAVTRREAAAEGFLQMNERTRHTLFTGAVVKGDALSAARIAGIQAAKRTADLIPLCHPIATRSITIEFQEITDPSAALVRCTVLVEEKTGAEMEALTGASIALLTLYDMLKSLQKDMRITDLRLKRKTGGVSGDLKLD